MRGLVGVYIFISTDSIYDVCDPELRNNANQLISEDMDVRPASDQLYGKFRKEEEYGHVTHIHFKINIF